LDLLDSKVIVDGREVFSFSPQSARFLVVVDELLDTGVIESDAEFCRALSYSPSSFNRIRKEKRNVTVDLIVNICHEFRANPYYILFGEEPVLLLSNSIKRDIQRAKKGFADGDDMEKRLKKILSSSTYQKVMKERFWHQRVIHLATLVASLEVNLIVMSLEIRTLNKYLSGYYGSEKRPGDELFPSK
jgi:hypothetical protein